MKILPPPPRSEFLSYRNSLVVGKLRNIFPDKKLKILDLGCGSGEISYLLSKNPRFEVTGVDVLQKCTAFAKRKYQRPNLKFVKADAYNLPFKGQYFDVVFSLGFESVAALPGVLPEVKRIVKKNGIVILDYINHLTLYNLPKLVTIPGAKKHMTILRSAMSSRKFLTYPENQSIRYHFGILGIGSYLKKFNNLEILNQQYIYCLPSFMVASRWIALDNFLGKSSLGPFLGRAILITAKLT